MTNRLLVIAVFCLSTIFSNAQVGINTTNPKGSLDVTSINNTGLVLPRVSAVEDVTDGNGNPPAEGTTVFDLSRSSTCYYQNGGWVCILADMSGNPILTQVDPPVFDSSSTSDYLKASNNDSFDNFGNELFISADGSTLAIAATLERSNATGINGNQANNSVIASGAVYVFIKNSGNWTQEAYIKASNTEFDDQFGKSVSLSEDGNTLAITAIGEDSAATGINGNEANNGASNSGAVYVFIRNSGTWTQEAYIKASNTDANDRFGEAISLSQDGNTLSIGATFEDSTATGINGDQSINSVFNSGAVYVFIRNSGNWTQEAYIKASNTGLQDQFGSAVTLSEDGNTLAVGASIEQSSATGINGNQADNNANFAGAVYIFIRVANVWTQEAYIKASNTDANDRFGETISLSHDGNTLAVGAENEDSNATGINGNQADNSANSAGAVYIYTRNNTSWSQEAYIKASNTEIGDSFGGLEKSVHLSANGNTLVVGARNEDSNATTINGDEINNASPSSGAIYVFKRNATSWSQEAYIKAPNSENSDMFGQATTISGDGTVIVVTAIGEDSNATGINGDQTNNSNQNSGGAYVFYAN